ncbi:MAG: 2,3-bisphosphoglycerate-independent phosphoglycerate mutase [Paracoccus sp. (in: a-proteobacteria)]|nr:2,3-bisphosphoglycerate-independent phosphoglycerate mutase [Paracoccus sp. (in: a-proteobacteria)]
MSRPVVLCILDGWGISDRPGQSAPDQAATPTYDRLMRECPHSTLVTFGPDVGLPRGQMGNSEVGHTNIGAGRVVAMDLGQIDLAIEDGSFYENTGLGEFVARLQASGGVAHLMGVVSDGGVHGHIQHLIAAARAVARKGVAVVIHAVTDGRDVPPESAMGFVTELQGNLPDGCTIGTVCGRYYAMDRDNRWERVGRAYDAMVFARAGHDAPDAAQAVQDAYARGETDEFIQPTVIAGYRGARDGDGFFCLNFRADRAREILSAVGDPEFSSFDAGQRPQWAALLGMVDYSVRHDAFMRAAYPKRQVVNTLGAWVAAHGLRQFRLAETEKYPHVTFFLNGGKEAPEPGEDRHMPASPKVATYDLAPEMAADEVGDYFIRAIEQGYDLIVVNFANPDMVGHTGSLPAAIRACEAVDRNLGRALEALGRAGGAAVIIADHGNCETMIDPETGGPHTAHTTNPVPVIVVGGPAGAGLRAGGRLADVAPTVLDLMGLAPPPEMTGTTLIQLP